MRTLILAFLLIVAPAFAFESRTTATAAAGVSILQGQLGWGVGTEVLKSVTVDPVPFRMGVDLGFYRWDYAGGRDPFAAFSSGAKDGRGTLISILPTFVWDFPVAGWQGAVPYVALTAGPAVYHGSARLEGVPLSDTSVGLLAWIRPGIRFSFSNVFEGSFETRLGIFRGEALFLTQFGAAWLL